MNNRLDLLIFCVVTALLPGCGENRIRTDYSKIGLVEVSGTVTLDGKPLAGALVVFEAEDRTFSSGMTDASGNYTLQFNSEKSGVPKGSKTIRFRSGASDEEGGNEGSKAPTGPSIPACYGPKSEIKVSVESSATFDFNLKSDCSTKSPA